VREPPTQRLGRHVLQLDLVGGPHDRVGHRLALRHAGDLLDDVVDRLQVLDVDRGDHVDPGVEQLLDVLPPLGVARPGHVGVRQLVDQRHPRAPGQDRVDVHLLEGGAAVLQPAPWHHLEALDHLGGMAAAVGLDEADHHVGAALAPAVRLAQHGVRLADPGRRTEVDPELPTTTHGPSLPARAPSPPPRRGRG